MSLEDADISKELERLFKKRGINLVTGAKVLPDSVKVTEGSGYFASGQAG